MPGPWSDLPPPSPPERTPKHTPVRWSVRRRGQGPREPFINNWRGLLIIAFLLFVAPVLARWVVAVIRAMTVGG